MEDEVFEHTTQKLDFTLCRFQKIQALPKLRSALEETH